MLVAKLLRCKGAPAHRSSAARNASSESGFERKSSIPSRRHRSRSRAIALAVCAITGVGRVPRARSRSRIAAVASNPSIPGIWQSINIASNRSRSAIRTASAPLDATATTHPSRSSIRRDTC